MAPVIIAAIITAGISAATVGYEVANQPHAPKAPTPVANNTQLAREQQAAALAQAQALQKRRGLSSTILTSPTGVTSGPAQSQTATLGT